MTLDDNIMGRNVIEYIDQKQLLNNFYVDVAYAGRIKLKIKLL